MKTIQKFVIILIGLTLTGVLPTIAQKGTGNLYGIGQEKDKPPTEIISGELVEIKTGPCENTTGYAYTGTHLFIKNSIDDRVLNIHLGAAFAVETYVNQLTTGDVIELQVFRTELLKPDNYIAQQVTANGHTLQLRDENLRPFWAGDSFSQRGWRNDFRRKGSW